MNEGKRTSMGSVLLTNGFLRKTLAVTRDLGRRGLSVTVADDHRPNPSAWSKYATSSRLYPNPVENPDAFTGWLLKQLSGQGVDMLLPMDDDTMDICVDIQDDLAKRTQVLLPNRSVYRLLRDKYTATEAAAGHGFQVPNTVLPHDAQDLFRQMHGFNWPVVVKPRQSSGSRGLRVARTLSELTAAYRASSSEHPSPMVQSYVEPGVRTDICLLLGRGQELIAHFAQRELRHFPLPYGPSTVQESVQEEELVERCYAFAKHLGWTGLIEFEFMQDNANETMYFLEANTRPWNSLHLAIAAGVPFPWLVYDYLVNNQVPEPAAPVGPATYRLGVRCRNLLPTDILHFITNPKRRQIDPPFFSGRATGGVDDILSLSDFMPTFGFFFALTAHAFRKGAIKDAFQR